MVFEDMIDSLISDDTKLRDKRLADQRDGKIVDHIYQYESLVHKDKIYYIGDSKYYKEGSDPGDPSIYKQFTYAKNVIQWNLNLFLDEDEFPDNVKPIMSAWEGMECDNRHNLPMSHVLYEDGRTTAPEYGAVYCGGNCSECAFKGEGCWNLKRGEHVIFMAH